MPHRLFSDQKSGFSRFYCDTRIFSCATLDQTREKLEFVLQEVEGVSNVLVLTDTGVEKTDFFPDLLPQNVQRTTVLLGVESDIGPMREAIDKARESDCQAIVAIGGGSVLDSAKLIAATLGSGVALEDLRATDCLPMAPLALLCIPTTFGTGSETNMYGHLSTPDGKTGLRKVWLTPKYAFLTPPPGLALSPRQRYLTGLDAWTHAFETLTLKRERNPFSNALLTQALALHKQHFRAFVEAPDTLGARAMAEASAMAGLGLNNARTGVIHTLSVPFAARFAVPHALSIAPFIRPAIRYNWDGIQHLFAQDTAASFIKETDDTVLFQLDRQLADLDIKVAPEDIAAMTAKALDDTVLTKENPVPIDRDDIATLYENALEPWM